MSKPILNRTYPYDVIRTCPRCYATFNFTIHRENQSRYYPKCIDCCKRKPNRIEGQGPRAHRTIALDETTTREARRKAMFEQHAVNSAVYYKELRKHRGLK